MATYRNINKLQEKIAALDSESTRYLDNMVEMRRNKYKNPRKPKFKFIKKLNSEANREGSLVNSTVRFMDEHG